jgi:hypothetical protein
MKQGMTTIDMFSLASFPYIAKNFQKYVENPGPKISLFQIKFTDKILDIKIVFGQTISFEIVKFLGPARIFHIFFKVLSK